MGKVKTIMMKDNFVLILKRAAGIYNQESFYAYSSLFHHQLQIALKFTMTLYKLQKVL